MPLFVFSSLLIVIVVCRAEHETCGVFPKDPIIQMGSEIQIMFRSSQGSLCGRVPSYSPHELIWKLNGRTIARDSYVINSTMSAVTIRNSGIVTCHMPLDGRDIELGGTNIKVLRLPAKPTLIRCILFAIEEFTCYWERGEETASDTQYILCGTYLHSGMKKNCSSHTDRCTIDTVQMPLNITVTATNAVGSVASDFVVIDPFEKLKVRPPEIASLKPVLDKLEVQWRIPQPIALPQLMKINCELLYQYEDVSEAKRVQMADANRARAEIAVERSCVNYTVSVRCAPDSVSEDAYWSDWSPSFTIMAPLDVLKIHLWRKIDEPDERGLRKVMLMWKGALPSCSIDGYRVIVKNLRSGNDSVLRFHVLDTNTSLVLGGEEHRISIAAYKNDNTSPEANIAVPAVGEDRAPVEDLQAFPQNSQLYVTWRRPRSPQSPADRYIVEWSFGGDDIRWRESQNTSASLEGQPFKLYRITVSPLYNSWPGQGTTLLAYFKEGAPGNISARVTDIQDRSAQVSWTSIARSRCCGFVQNYTVFYKSETGPELGVTVNSSVEEVVLKVLDPGKKYSIHVTASSVGGTTNSSLLIFTTRPYGTTFLKILGAFGGLGVILFITISLGCLVLLNKYFSNVPSPKFSTLALWLNEPLKDEMQSNICTPSAESYFHQLEIHPYSFDSTVIEISPSPLETPGDQHDQPHPASEHTKAGTVALVRASAAPSMFIGPSQSCGHSTLEMESGGRRPTVITPGGRDPKDCDSTKPCWGSILGKNGYVGEETLLPPSKEVQPFLEPPKNVPQSYVTLDLFGQPVSG